MALSQERLNAIAMRALQEKLEKNGDLKLIPSEIKRTVHNLSKNLNFSAKEMAEFMKSVLQEAYTKTIAELDAVISSGKVEE